MNRCLFLLVLGLLPLVSHSIPRGTKGITQALRGYDLPDAGESSWDDSSMSKMIRSDQKEEIPEQNPAEDDPCCSGAKKVQRDGETRNNLSARRFKRYPMHLDPLYHYRFLARSGQCPTAEDGQPEFYCPTPDRQGNWRCIDDFQLCDGMKDCPNGEDELPVPCLFFRVVETHLNSIGRRLNTDEGRPNYR